MTTASAPALPPGACNAHCHVFGPRDRFPYAPDASFVPAADAPKDALFTLNDRLGLSRCVVVQSACHGFDNRAADDAVASRPQAYRGVALLPPGVSDAELRRLDAAGFRGVRFNYMGHLGRHTPLDEVLALARRLARLGWHLQIHGDPSLLTGMAGDLKRSPVPVVIDHIGRIDASHGLQPRDFQALVRLMKDPRFWVKLSGMDRITRLGPPYEDAQPFARLLIENQVALVRGGGCVGPGWGNGRAVAVRLAGQRTGGDVDALLAQRRKRFPLGFMGDGRDTASAVLFLVSDDACFITGTELVVDGGMTARCD